ncbi:MAG TPA: hypothetical protein VIB48_03440 [Acidimicrobiia bacterium]|jgi:hypothetical protein
MAKKIVLIVLGAVGILVSLALFAGGAALFALFSPHGWLESGEHRVDTPTRALVSQSADFKDAASALNSFGDFRLRLRARASEPAQALFIGVGATTDVEQYVRTFRHDRVTNLDFQPFRLSKRPAGPDGVAVPPATQTFWVQHAQGTGTQTLDWKIRDGSYELVLMNADARTGVDANAVFAVRVPFAHTLGIVFFVVGAIALALGILLLVLGIRVRPKRRPAPPAWPPPGGPTSSSAPPPGAGPERAPPPAQGPAPPAQGPAPPPAQGSTT